VKAGHVVQVSSYYPPHLGGQENAVHDLAQQLANGGYRVDVLASTEGGGESGKKMEKGIRVHRLRGFVFGHAPIMPWFVPALFRTASAKSIVHVHIGQAFTPEMVWLTAKLRGFKYIAQLHIDFEPSGPAGIFLPLYKRLLLKHALRSASAIIVLNKKTQQMVRTAYGYKGPVELLNNGLDDTYFTLKHRSFTTKPPKVLRLLFVGRLSKQKNLPALLDALKQTRRDVQLDIIGEGDEREVVQKIIQKYGLTNVTLHGRLPREKTAELYKTHDALIMPSLYEAQPLVLLEALAAKIPIIGTNVIGVVDHIKDVGIVVEPTADGLTEGIERYFTEYGLLSEMVHRGYQQAEKLRWPHTLKKYEALYEEVLGN